MQSSIEPLLELERLGKDNILIQHIKNQQIIKNNLDWDMLRLDLIHPICSGNKLFKLKYYLIDAIAKKYKIVKTFGGAWSNHIVATAFLANSCGLKSIGIIRGEEPKVWSQTLLQAKEYGMTFDFISRSEFSNYQNNNNNNNNDDIYTIPQGGSGTLGVKGAAEISFCADLNNYSHIICACGTGTMFAGLVHASQSFHKCIGISVLKNPELISEVKSLLSNFPEKRNYTILNDYHWGGYAKKDNKLLDFMNQFYNNNKIPTDFIYTAKMVYAIEELINKGFFKPGSKILSIHSGGLQGNNSIKNGILVF